MNKFNIIESFKIEKGLVVTLDTQTKLHTGKAHDLILTLPNGEVLESQGYKEWLLRRQPTPIESEAFLLTNLAIERIPIGSTVVFK